MNNRIDPDMEAGSAEEPQHNVELLHPPHWKLLRTRGVFGGLHATHAQYHDPQLDATVDWSARQHRKGRRVVVRALVVEGTYVAAPCRSLLHHITLQLCIF